MGKESLLSLLHLCDSLFPTGGFAHSDGLEAAAAWGRVSASPELRDWIEVCLDENLARIDGPAVLRAWLAWTEERWTDLADLDAEVYALRPSSAGRAASRAMGTRLIRTWRETHPESGPPTPWRKMVRVSRRSAPDPESTMEAARARALPDPAFEPVMTLPVAFGVICATAGIDGRSAVEGFIYTRLAATASSAMRLMAIGQREAHARLAATLARVPAAIDDIEAGVMRGEGLGAFAPAADVATMAQQYVRSRLFLS